MVCDPAAMKMAVRRGALSHRMELLIGPVAPIGATGYDTAQLAEGAAFVGDTSSSRNFYDGALAYYHLYYRTGDAQWAVRGDFLAQEMADYQMDPANTDAQRDASGRSAMAGKDYATLGMSIHYLRTGYATSLAAVRCQAAGGFWYRTYVHDGPNNDARTGAYGLMAELATTILGGDVDYSAHMLAQINNAIAVQGIDQSGVRPHSAWENTDNGSQVPALYYVSNFMCGLFSEALILYDRVIGDSRIVPMLKTYADWLWSTQWVPLGGGPVNPAGVYATPGATSATSFAIGTGSKVFTTQAGLSFFTTGQLVWVHSRGDVTTVTNAMNGIVTAYSGTSLTLNVVYVDGSGTHSDWDLYPAAYPGDQLSAGIGTVQYSNTLSGTEAPTSHAEFSDLNGLNLPVFGYLYFKGQGAQYKTRGDALRDGMLQSTWFLIKQYNQGFRSSPRYLGWTT